MMPHLAFSRGPVVRKPIGYPNQTPPALPHGTPQDLFALLARMHSENKAKAAIMSLQNQLAVQTQANIGLQQTVATQNQNIEAMKAQAQSLQNSINSLNSTIATLQAQLAVVPSLQAQIEALATQVAELRTALNLIIAMI